MSGATFQPTTLIVRSRDAAVWEHSTEDNQITETWYTYLTNMGVTMSNVDTSILHQFRKNTSKMALELKQPLHRPKGIRINKVVVPNQIATFNDTNKILKLFAKSKVVGVVDYHITVTMPTNRRFLTYAEVAAEINTQLQTTSSLYSCTADASGKLTITAAANSNHYLIVIEPNSKLGFDYGVPPLPYLSSSPIMIVSPSPIILQSTRALYVRSSSFGLTSAHCSDNATDILTMFPYDEDVSSFGGSTSFVNPNMQTYINVTTQIHTMLSFELLDDDLNVVNLRRHNWALEVSFAY